MKNTTKTSKVGFLLVALLGLLFVSCATHPAPTVDLNKTPLCVEKKQESTLPGIDFWTLCAIFLDGYDR